MSTTDEDSEDTVVGDSQETPAEKPSRPKRKGRAAAAEKKKEEEKAKAKASPAQPPKKKGEEKAKKPKVNGLDDMKRGLWLFVQR